MFSAEMVTGNRGAGWPVKHSGANRSERLYMSNVTRDSRKPAGRPAGPAAREVAFVLNHPGAESVYLCGDFNEWFPAGLPMISRAEGHLWEKRLLLRPGRYEYKFIVDGVWMHNPDAGQNVPNAFGSMNSVVEVRP